MSLASMSLMKRKGCSSSLAWSCEIASTCGLNLRALGVSTSVLLSVVDKLFRALITNFTNDLGLG